MNMKDTHDALSGNGHETAMKFCLNCDDMDDLAVSEASGQLDELHRRFENCVNTGRFDGDLCSRIFVAEDAIDSPDFFADDPDAP